MRPFADSADAVQDDGTPALFFVQDFDTGDILGLHHVNVAICRNDVFDFAAKTQMLLDVLGQLHQPPVVGRAGNVGLALHLVDAVPAVAELPVAADHFGHDAGPVDKRHDDDAHLIEIQVGSTVEVLLPGNAKVPAGCGKFDHLVAGITDTAHIGIGFQRIEGASFETALLRMGAAGDHLEAFPVFFQKLLQGLEILVFEILGRQVNKIGNGETGLLQFFQQFGFFGERLIALRCRQLFLMVSIRSTFYLLTFLAGIFNKKKPTDRSVGFLSDR